MIVQLHRLIVCSNKIEYISKCDGVSAQDGDHQVWPAGGEAQVGREPGAARPHVQVTRSMVTAVTGCWCHDSWCWQGCELCHHQPDRELVQIGLHSVPIFG